MLKKLIEPIKSVMSKLNGSDTLRIAVIGAEGAGKSNIIDRFIDVTTETGRIAGVPISWSTIIQSRLEDGRPTPNREPYAALDAAATIGARGYRLRIWDTKGGEILNPQSEIFEKTRDCDFLLLVVPPETLEHITVGRKTETDAANVGLGTHVTELVKNNPDAMIAIALAKADQLGVVDGVEPRLINTPAQRAAFNAFAGALRATDKTAEDCDRLWLAFLDKCNDGGAFDETRRQIFERTRPLWQAVVGAGRANPALVNAYLVAARPEPIEPQALHTWGQRSVARMFADFFARVGQTRVTPRIPAWSVMLLVVLALVFLIAGVVRYHGADAIERFHAAYLPLVGENESQGLIVNALPIGAQEPQRAEKVIAPIIEAFDRSMPSAADEAAYSRHLLRRVIEAHAQQVETFGMKGRDALTQLTSFLSTLAEKLAEKDSDGCRALAIEAAKLVGPEQGALMNLASVFPPAGSPVGRGEQYLLSHLPDLVTAAEKAPAGCDAALWPIFNQALIETYQYTYARTMCDSRVPAQLKAQYTPFLRAHLDNPALEVNSRLRLSARYWAENPRPHNSVLATHIVADQGGQRVAVTHQIDFFAGKLYVTRSPIAGGGAVTLPPFVPRREQVAEPNIAQALARIDYQQFDQGYHGFDIWVDNDAAAFTGVTFLLDGEPISNTELSLPVLAHMLEASPAEPNTMRITPMVGDKPVMPDADGGGGDKTANANLRAVFDYLRRETAHPLATPPVP